jgi:acyl-coenzyme A thioesterase PaaI-like protein
MTRDGQGKQGESVDAADPGVPDGFSLVTMQYGFMGMVGPLYHRADAHGEVLAVRVEERHCNLGKVAHGGMITALADIAIGYRLVRSRKPLMWSLSLSLNTDFVGTAPLGCWLEARATLRRVGSSIAFVACDLSTEGKTVAIASSVLKILSQSGGRDEALKSSGS